MTSSNSATNWLSNEFEDTQCADNSDHNIQSNEIRSTNNEPYVGMEFTNTDDAYNFYNCYAINEGFGIRKSTSTKSRVTGELIGRKFECDKAGLKIAPNIDELNSRQRDTRVGCRARMNVVRKEENIWVITVFEKEHNHDLDTPRRAKKHRSHNVLHKKSTVRNLIDQLHSSGMGPSRIAKTLNATIESESISAKNISNHLRDLRKNNVGKEGVLIYDYLKRQQKLDSNFYFAIELSDDGMLRSFFWADSRSRNDYLIFGDVIVFDVTYKTNKFMMPFAPFTGINHHRQSILFGCALLADETEETFIWLFRQWLECMFEKSPIVIITDMDGAMYNAIKIVFPNTRHRFCSWHIGKHIVEHVYEMRNKDSEFKNDYNKWLNSKSIKTCEKRWEEFVAKYDVSNQSWLAKMWAKRTHWVPAYLKDVFVAGMTSSSRSESINSFFDGFVNSNTPLLEFVNQYENALKSRREAEEKEDYMTMNSIATLFTSISIEKLAAQIYTRKMFKLFQQEFKCSLECWYEEVSSNDHSTIFKVGMSNEDTNRWCNITYNDDDGILVTCECAKFETEGYLCKHILHIMIAKKHLKYIPQEYILRRWTIAARNLMSAGNEGNEETYITPMMKWKLTDLTKKIIDIASTSATAYQEISLSLESLIQKYSQAQEKIAETEIQSSHIGSSTFSSNLVGISIRDPEIVKTKGRPKVASRISSGIEASQNQSKKRTCGSCGGKGHYTTTCPFKEKDLQEKGKDHLQ